MKMHTAQEPVQHVTLINQPAKKPADARCGNGSFKDQALYQVAPTGEVADKPYEVAKGYVLVVTDVEWYVVLNSSKRGPRTVHLTSPSAAPPSSHPAMSASTSTTRGCRAAANS